MTAASHSDSDQVRAAAFIAHRAGLCIVPADENGAKRPDLDGWKAYQSQRPTEDEIDYWFANGRTGIGTITGAVSDNLEAIDFDSREIFEAFVERAQACGLGELVERVRDGYEERTPNGVHLLIRCERIDANLKLANRAADKKALIETRGEGGFLVLAPSHGRVHTSGRPYVLVRGGFDSIVSVTGDEREALLELARSFDESPRPEHREPEHERPPRANGELRPGDDYNMRATWPEVLEPHGWRAIFTSAGETYWRRPGKSLGTSATTNYKGSDLFYCFTTSTVFETERGYSKFSAYSILNHEGDFPAAARALGAKGYGAQSRAKAPRVSPSDSAESQASGEHEESASPVSDVANAIRLARSFRDELCWTPGLRWLAWDGQRWARSESKAIGFASQLGRIVHEEAAEASQKASAAETTKQAREELGALAEALTKFARESEREPRILAALSLARHRLEVDEKALDAEPMILNVLNGTIDLRTGERRDHRREDLSTRLAPVIYKPEARADLWQKFLERVLPDAEMRAFVQRAVGYSLTGLTTEQIMILLWGGGANGKTTLIETLLAMLGDYAIRTPTDALLARRDNTIPNDVAQLRGARFAAAVETEEGRRLAEVRVKELTGGDTVSARFMRGEWFQFKPICKLWLASNHRPQVRGTDEAIWRRIRLVPFVVQIPEAERDPRLPERLLAELPGILAWAVQGCLQWQRGGLRAPDAVRVATSDYRAAEDVLGEFLEERCAAGEGRWVPRKQLYADYRSWAESSGEKPMTQKALATALRERGFGEDRMGKARIRIWRGLDLDLAVSSDEEADR